MVSHQLHWRLFESITFLVKNFPSESISTRVYNCGGVVFTWKETKQRSKWMNVYQKLCGSSRVDVEARAANRSASPLTRVCRDVWKRGLEYRRVPTLSTVKVLTSLLNFARRESANSKHVLTVSSSITYLSTFGRVHSRFIFLTLSPPPYA